LQDEDKIYKSKRRYYIAEFYQDNGWSIFAGYLNFFLTWKRISQSPIEDGIEETLIQFANHIGAFMLYTLIEAMRPTRNIIPRSMRIDKAHDFIEIAIPHMDLFSAFVNSLPKAYRKDIVLGAQMRENSFNKLFNSFRNIYPHFYKNIEQGYQDYFQGAYLETIDDYSNCRHEWKETFVHKLGLYDKCRKCRAFKKSLSSN
jgi:hypothetical protein